MATDDLIDELADRGFEPVDSDARGGWATDGSATIQIVTEHGPRGLGPHEVTVFDAPADSLDITEDVVGRVRDQPHGIAVRNALQLLEDDGRDDKGERTGRIGAGTRGP